MKSATQAPLWVFISYAHEDEALCHEFIKHLSELQREGLVRDWYDREITGGSEWAEQINERLNSADIIVLLVSPDFLASEYCCGVEMTRALEREKAHQARVVPVILRPSEWATSALAKFNALPQDGKPVVDWPTVNPNEHDHGFLNVVEGLRGVALELRPPAASTPPPESSEVPERPWMRKLRRWPFAVASGLILLCLLGLIGIAAARFRRASQQRSERVRQYLAQGDDQLKVGRYEGAREPYQQALRLSANNPVASIRLQIIDLAKLRPDAVAFDLRLYELLGQAPRDPYLKVLEGDYLVGQGKPDDAMKCYKDAIALNPDLAEAYFRMGVLYDQRRDIARARRMYQDAVRLAPSSPQYACNLADQYFKHGEYPEAIRVYGRIRQYPLAALESAKIHRLLGDLKDAAEQESVAIEWLGQPSVKNMPENQFPWLLDRGGGQFVSLPSDGEKLCYANLEFSATLYLDGDEAKAKNQSDAAARDCGARSRQIKGVMRAEMQRLAQEQEELAGRAAAYRKRFLAE
jgi:tetratricopeptide (TPR) repeat protein